MRAPERGGALKPPPWVSVPKITPPASPINRGGGEWEEDDAYPCLAKISGDCRVIECKDAYQWILQHRRGGRWHNVSYHLDRECLIERSGATGEALAILRRLPRRHGTGVAL
jgi:hypothetical protein